MADCKFCGNKAGFLRGKHKDCQAKHDSGRQQMVAMVASAAQASNYSEPRLRQELAAIAANCFVDPEGVNQVLSLGWQRAVSNSLSDSILTQEEESRLRRFRDEFNLEALDGAGDSAATQLVDASWNRLTRDARVAAIATSNGEAHLKELEQLFQESWFSAERRRAILVQAWEAAVEGSVEDRVVTLEEEEALVRYLVHFGFSQDDVDTNGAYSTFIKSLIIRDAMEGIIPQRLNLANHPFNLMKSEQLVWVIDNVDYLETKIRRERRGTSHGVSVRVARGLYYSPRSFRSESVEWDEQVHSDTGILGVTSKHLYFHGPKKRFRIRYDKIVSFEHYNDGIGIMRDGQSAKPQDFRTGDGWFICNLVTNLANQ